MCSTVYGTPARLWLALFLLCSAPSLWGQSQTIGDNCLGTNPGGWPACQTTSGVSCLNCGSPLTPNSNMGNTSQCVRASQQRVAFNVVAGQTYKWSLCPADGVNNNGQCSDDDGTLWLYNASGNAICYADNEWSIAGCGDAYAAVLVWTATYTGVVTVMPGDWPCVNSSCCYNIGYSTCDPALTPNVPNVTVCASQQVSLTGLLGTTTPNTVWYNGGTCSSPGTQLATGTTYTYTAPSTPGTQTFLVRNTNCFRFNYRCTTVTVTTVAGSNFGSLSSSNTVLCPSQLPFDPPVINMVTPATTGSTYQWYTRSGSSFSCPTGSSTSGWTAISGATGNSYDPPAIPTGTTGVVAYAVLVTPQGGSCQAQWATNCVRYTVNNVSYGQLANPQTETTCDPANIAFGAFPSTAPSASAGGTFTYQWYFQDGVVGCPAGNSTTGWTAISGATGSSYNPPAIPNSRTFAVVVTHPCGSQWATRCRQVTTPAVTAPTVANATICSGQTATLTATGPTPLGNFTFRWFDAATGGSQLGTGTSYTTPALTGNTTYYVEAAATCGVSARTAVTVTVRTRPAAPTVASTTICSGQTATLNVTAPTPGTHTFNWFTAPTGGASFHTGASYTTPALGSTVTYYVESVLNGCASTSRTAVTVTVGATGTTPTVTPTNPTICSEQTATLDVTAPTPLSSYTFSWYTVATGGTAFHTGASYTTPALTANTTYFVESAIGSCVSGTRQQVDITVVAPPTVPTVVPAAPAICAGQTVTLNVTAPTPLANYVFEWFDAPTGGTLLSTGTSFTTPALSTSTTYHVLARTSSGNCASPARGAVTVTVNPLPANATVTTPTPTICQGQTATLTVTDPAPLGNYTFDWYDAPTGGTLLFTGASYTTPALAASTTYHVAVRENATACTSSGRSSQTITVTPTPPDASVTPDRAVLCAGETTTLRATGPTPTGNFTFRWFDAATGGNLLFTGVDYTPPVLTTDLTVYTEVQVAGPCASNTRTMTTVVVNPLPDTVRATTTTPVLCAGNSAVLNVTAPTPLGDFTFDWFTNPTGGTAIHTGTSYTTPILSATTTWYIQATNAQNCSTTLRTPITVTVNSLPAQPQASTNQASYCVGDSATLTATDPAPPFDYLFTWFATANGGTPLATGTAYTTPALTADTAVYLQVEDAQGCQHPQRTRIALPVNPLPQPPVVSVAEDTLCAGENALLAVTGPLPLTDYTFLWFAQSTGGAPLHTGSTFAPQALTRDTTFWVASLSTSNCTSASRSSVSIVIRTQPGTPVVQPTPQVVCAGSAAQFTVTAVPGLTYRWWDAATGGTQLGTGTSYTTPALSADTQVYVEAVDDQGCVSLLRAQAIATVPQFQPLTVDAPAVCSGQTATLTVIAPAPVSQYTYSWFADAGLSQPLGSGSSLTTGILQSDTVFYVLAAQSGCQAPAAQAVSVTVNPLPVAAQLADVSLCPGASVTLTVLNPQPGHQYEWYTAASGGTPVHIGNSWTLSNVTTPVTYHVEAVLPPCTLGVRTPVAVSLFPAAPEVQATGAERCGPGAVTLAVTGPQPLSDYRFVWTDASGAEVGTGTSLLTPVLNASTTYQVRAITADGCTSQTATRADALVLTPPTADFLILDTLVEESTPVRVQNLSSNADGFVWLLDGEPFANQASPGTVPGTFAGVHRVQLVALRGGCPDTATATLRVEEVLLDLPNAFSPNGDGVNDLFRLRHQGLQRLQVLIFDRWGLQVFSNGGNPALEWTGEFNGKPCPEDVYAVRATATSLGGRALEKIGTITLIR